MFKKIIPILTALAVVPSAVCFTAHADDIINTRYHDTSPVHSGHHGGGGTSFADKLRYYMQSVSDYLLNGVYSAGDAVVGFAKDYADSDTTSFDFYNALNSQRLVDLAEYANRSTTPPTNWQSFCFTARRRLVYPSGLSEVDTLYYWEDSSTTLHPQTQLQGVAIGDFIVQPNTVFVIRNFSDGTSDVFYTNTSEFNVNEYGLLGSGGNVPFVFSFTRNQSITIYNSEGVAESATLGSLSRDSNVFFARNPKNSDGDEINSITTERLVLLNSQNPTKYEQFVGDRLSNLSCLLGNVIDANGTEYVNNSSYILTSPNMSLNVWYISSGGSIARPSTPYSNTFNTDPNTIDPSRPPWLLQPDNKYYTPITQENITNYNDYGITYNNTTNSFDVDLTALAGAVGAQLQPTFDGTFDGTFNAQPNVGLDYSQPLDLNLDDTMADVDLTLGDIYNQLLPQPPWVAPSFPALETDPIVSYTYPTLPTNTVPQSVLDDVGTVSGIGFDAFGTLGDSIIGILVALAVLGAVSYYIWG